MRVLVACASRHGATRGIAERIADRLRIAGLDAEAVPVKAVRHPERYDAFVVGSALYMFHWLGEASAFVRRHRGVLAARPVWLFSSGPIGTATVNEQGQDVREAAGPKELAELMAAVGARGHRVFFGAFDPNAPRIGFAEQLVLRMPAARNAFPAGDFRDWDEIDAWADAIAAELAKAPSAAERV